MAANDNQSTLDILYRIKNWCEEQLAGKQATLTFDNAPELLSPNPVTSGGLYEHLLRYYYTKGDIDTLLTAIKQFTYQTAQTLPTASAETMFIVYLIPSPNPQQANAKDEYITIRSGAGTTQDPYTYAWEQIGTTTVDLSDYPEFEEVEGPDDLELINEYTAVLQRLYQAITDSQAATANAKADYVGDDNYVYTWDKSQSRYIKTNKYVKGDPGTTDYNDLLNKPTIPDELKDLASDSGHRTVSDTEKTSWNSKAAGQHTHTKSDITDFAHTHDLKDLGDDSTHRTVTDTEKSTWNGKYAKPQGGIPESDCDFSVMEWEENDDPCSLLSSSSD